MSERYTTEVFWSEEDGGFIAICPDLLGCSAFGETRDEAITELNDAIKSWIMAAKEVGNEVPKPYIKRSYETCSGKTLLRLPKELHADLIEGARRQGVSFNAYVNYLLTQQHYAADAVREFGNSLEWRALAVNKQIFVTLGSCNMVPAEQNFSKSSDEFIPVGALGMAQNA